MPGYSVDRFPELSVDDRDKYTCSICQEIFNTPVTTTCCRQTFCEECITEWLKTNTACPYNRKTLTKSGLYRTPSIIKCLYLKPLTKSGFSQPPRAMLITLSRFKIQCTYWDHGCHEVIKLDELPKHTANCRYACDTCPKCHCERTPGHDCISALLAKNSELKKQLDQVDSLARPDGHVELTPGHDCLAALQSYEVEIDALKQTLKRALESGQVYLNQHQLLAECQRHLSATASDVLENNINADMTSTTLAIVRDVLAKQHSLYHVCKHVCAEMDLEYGTSWHCMAHDSKAGQAHCTTSGSYLMMVKIGPITLLLYRTDTVNVQNLKARLQCNKIGHGINIIGEHTMSANMVESVKAITFAAIARSTTMYGIARNIVKQMDLIYKGMDWQCVVSMGNSYGNYVTSKTQIDFDLDQFNIFVYSAV